MIKPIYSITPFTLLDYPGHPACILWFAGCNMRCLYCYNPDIVLGKGKLSVEDMDTMVTYLERQGYEGKYFIQYFKNGVKTLSPLPYTNSRLDPIRLSTEKIKVEIRTT